MTRDELLAQFSNPMYAEVRKYIHKIMQEHPEVEDKFWIESAAEQMLECATDGVAIGTDNALRLTKGKKEIPLDELVRRLSEAGVTNANVIDVILGAELGDDFVDGRRGECCSHAAFLSYGVFTMMPAWRCGASMPKNFRCSSPCPVTTA